MSSTTSTGSCIMKSTLHAIIVDQGLVFMVGTRSGLVPIFVLLALFASFDSCGVHIARIQQINGQKTMKDVINRSSQRSYVSSPTNQLAILANKRFQWLSNHRKSKSYFLQKRQRHIATYHRSTFSKPSQKADSPAKFFAVAATSKKYVVLALLPRVIRSIYIQKTEGNRESQGCSHIRRTVHSLSVCMPGYDWERIDSTCYRSSCMKVE